MEILLSLIKAPIALVLVLILIWILIRSLPLRKRGSGFKYVYVDENRSVRELDSDERTYLNTKFHGSDGARPYIKSHFWSRTSDRKVSGYLRKVQVPWWIEISHFGKPSTNRQNLSGVHDPQRIEEVLQPTHQVELGLVERNIHVGTLHQPNAVITAEGATEGNGEFEDLPDGHGQFVVPESIG